MAYLLLLSSLHVEQDVATSFADNARAVAELDWKPQYGLEDMLKDSWNWQSRIRRVIRANYLNFLNSNI